MTLADCVIPRSYFGQLQALGFQIPWRTLTVFFCSVPRDHGKLSVTIFWFCENSWQPTFISFNVQKQFSGNMLLN